MVSHLSYESRLKIRSISLYYRFQRGNLIEAYKTLNNYYDMEPTICTLVVQPLPEAMGIS